MFLLNVPRILHHHRDTSNDEVYQYIRFFQGAEPPDCIYLCPFRAKSCQSRSLTKEDNIGSLRGEERQRHNDIKSIRENPAPLCAVSACAEGRQRCLWGEQERLLNNAMRRKAELRCAITRIDEVSEAWQTLSGDSMLRQRTWPGYRRRHVLHYREKLQEN